MRVYKHSRREDIYKVKDDSNGVVYTVRHLDEGDYSCTCGKFSCSHVVAVEQVSAP